MGSSKSKVSTESSLLDKPWRDIHWKDKKGLCDSLLKELERQSNMPINILLYGPVGAGKSTFINSLQTAFFDTSANIASCSSDTNRIHSFTITNVKYNLKKMKPYHKLPVVLIDSMGLEVGDAGVLPEDLRLVMMGHVKENYQFNPSGPLQPHDAKYNPNPSIEDKVHVLICVISANSPDFQTSIFDKILKTRKYARDLGIPDALVLTNIDLFCDEVENDVKNVYKSKLLKAKMEELSSKLGVPLNYIFPVKNYSEGEIGGIDDMDILFLTALKHIVNYGNNYIDTHTEKSD